MLYDGGTTTLQRETEPIALPKPRHHRQADGDGKNRILESVDEKCEKMNYGGSKSSENEMLNNRARVDGCIAATGAEQVAAWTTAVSLVDSSGIV